MNTDASTTPRALATEAVHAGREDLAALGLHAVPLDLSTTYPSYDSRGEAARIDEFAATGARPQGPPVYSRLDNPTTARFEDALARLEGAGSAVAFASGMAALTAVLLVRASAGLRHVVAVRPLYGCSDHLLNAGLLGTEVTWVDPAGIEDAIRPDTGLVIVETPANPTLAEIDVRAVARSCGSVPLLVDNTFASAGPPAPAGGRRTARPAQRDQVPGRARRRTGRGGGVRRGARPRAAPGAVRDRRRTPSAGRIPAAARALHTARTDACGVGVRGRTRPAAVRRARVARVHYPKLGGAMVAFEVYGDPHAVIGGVRLITPAVSLGSVDSLIQHPASISHRIVAEGDRRSSGVSDRLLRMSVGLEDVEDLWRDLCEALSAAGAAAAVRGPVSVPAPARERGAGVRPSHPAAR